MAKPSTEVDKNLLQRAIDQAESSGPLKNLDALWKAACAIYNNSAPPTEITFSVVALRAKAWSLNTVTKPGKKGRAAGVPLSEEQKQAMQAGRGKRVPRSEKFASQPEIVDGFNQLRRNVPTRFQPLVDKLILKGSMKAAVALNCLDCTAFQPIEVKLCPCNGCPLFAFRPYKKKNNDSDSTDSDDELELNDDELEDSEESEE